MLSDMTTRIGPTRMLISESINEAMLGGLHAFLSIYGWIGAIGCGTIPAWQAVYGGWTVNLGDIRYPPKPRQGTTGGLLAFNTTEAAAFRAITAQNLVSGSVLGWFTISSDWTNSMGLIDADAAFIMRLAATKVNASKYLTFGRLWRPPRWVHPPPMMWLHDYGYMEHDPQQGCPTPMVLVECWQAEVRFRCQVSSIQTPTSSTGFTRVAVCLYCTQGNFPTTNGQLTPTLCL